MPIGKTKSTAKSQVENKAAAKQSRSKTTKHVYECEKLLGQPVAQFNASGLLVAATPEYRQLVEIADGQIGVASFDSLNHNGAASLPFSQVVTSLEQNKFNHRFTRTTTNGRVTWYQSRFAVVRGKQGDVESILEFATDVTSIVNEERTQQSRASDFEGQVNAIGRSQAVIEFDLQGKILFANDNFLNALGYTLDEIVGKHHSLFVEPQYANSHEYRQFWSELQAGTFQSAEFRRFTKSGKEIWIQASYNPIFGADGKPYKVVKYATDVTEAKRRNVNFQGQLEAIGKAQAVIEFDLNGIVQTANENFLNVLGYSLEEIQGKHHSLFVESQYANSFEYRQFWDDLRAGKYKAAEYKRIGKGGKEVWIQASYNPILDPNGKPIKVVKFATDVTANKLRNADFQGQLEAIGKSLAVIEFDLNGIVQNANDNFFQAMGYSLSEIKGKHHSTFVESSYSNSPEYKQFWDNLRAGTFEQGTYKRLAKGGKVVWLQASYNPIFDLNGKPCKVVKYASDITAAKEMEFAIAARQKQDELDATAMRNKVNEILEVVGNVARRDYSKKLTVAGEDGIGRLGEGLAKFFNEKEQTEIVEQARNERERAEAEEVARKVAIVLQIVNSIAAGDFTVNTPDLGSDAVGQVGSALNQAIAAIASALQEVRDVSSTVSTAAAQLTSVSREISSGAQSQASALEETASSLEEITSTVKQNTDNAQQARQLAVGSRDVAEKGGEVVGEAVKAMSEINQSSKKIADIITTIDEIAFQTNLLALNAAVEAARAGEQGRGFAVVASEVRNLAQRSASAAKEIKSLIQDSVRKVEVGTDLVNRSGGSLNEIVNSVKRVTDIVAEIAAASKEQLTGIEQVNKAVSQMDRVTQSNAAQTEEMSGTAESLLGNAQQLSELVERFSLADTKTSRNRGTKRDKAQRRQERLANQSRASSSPSNRIQPQTPKAPPLILDVQSQISGPGVLEF